MIFRWPQMEKDKKTYLSWICSTRSSEANLRKPRTETEKKLQKSDQSRNNGDWNRWQLFEMVNLNMAVKVVAEIEKW
jgi:hypothetical protein